jgi:dTDP-6-deoxy-L-talose 4-dehydrogenase (NAD+)
MRRLLITGATGFVGRSVLKALAGHPVKLDLVVRQDIGKELQSEFPEIQRVIVTPDIFAESEQWWVSICQGIDIVIHIAWYVEPGQYLQSVLNLDCLMGTLTLAKAATKAGVQRFIGIGTCIEYNLDEGVLSVDTPLNPKTLYAACKASSYLILSRWFEMHNVEFAWCRLFYLYGEGEDPRRLVPYLRMKLQAEETAELTSGKQIRDFLDVAKAGEMIKDVALSHYQGAINICSGEAITVRQLAEKIADEYGRRDLLKFGARPDNLVDPPRVIGVKNYNL